jgi:hypothetical protein
MHATKRWKISVAHVSAMLFSFIFRRGSLEVARKLRLIRDLCHSSPQNLLEIMTRNRHLIVFGLSFLTIVASAVPKPDEKRVLDHDFAQHMAGHDEHSKQYDHEQFLGEDQAKTFDQLAPEESRRRLG